MLNTLARTPLDKASARHRNIYQTIHNIHKRQRSMHLAGFIFHIPNKRVVIDNALARASTWIGAFSCLCIK